jgi:hypothetical protein
MIARVEGLGDKSLFVLQRGTCAPRGFAGIPRSKSLQIGGVI